MKRIGVFGGTFNPVHNGHLIFAEQAREEASLDQVLFMPTYIQPFKQEEAVSSPEARLAMLKRATSGNRLFDVTTVEIESKAISYTILSLEKLAETYRSLGEICFLIGADMFANIEKWYRVRELLVRFEVIVGFRPGAREDALRSQVAQIAEAYNARITLVQNREFGVSSSEIRDRVKQGLSIRYLVPDSVREYIDEAALFI
ncbi:MAG: nicotinate (nicotinamide) nucleotide adenylyltransferase [Clostridiales Family XIII bacterium]|jgi:nicotinate-nucleotide adenylyltransferase|nr:nicotinate (nicotinamide) nucleotide adenylyltransferase [Clostridiales Family XIII bacterium]